MQLSNSAICEFKNVLKIHYKEHYRPMPWREDTEPYFVLVSEIMLQQTQVQRVIPKFEAFISYFPTIENLANATLEEVLLLWSGLGYNRRAKFLKQAAGLIKNTYNGIIPLQHEELIKLPGVGAATASAILVYSTNKPVLFIETNIRQVLIYHFFYENEKVSDKELDLVLDQLLDRNNPREFYWAMMDYGTYLKKTVGNLNNRSKTYTKQSKFQGSFRQKRGGILRELLHGYRSKEQLQVAVNSNNEEVEKLLFTMVQEQLIEYNEGIFRIKN